MWVRERTFLRGGFGRNLTPGMGDGGGLGGRGWKAGATAAGGDADLKERLRGLGGRQGLEDSTEADLEMRKIETNS